MNTNNDILKPIFSIGVKTNNLMANNGLVNNLNSTKSNINTLNVDILTVNDKINSNVDINGNISVDNVNIQNNLNVSGNTQLNNLDVYGNTNFYILPTCSGNIIPKYNNQLVSKEYVDNTRIFNFQKSVQTASTEYIDISNPPSTIGGFNLSPTNRILLAGQNTYGNPDIPSINNGIYIYNGSDISLTIADDASGVNLYNYAYYVDGSGSEFNGSFFTQYLKNAIIGQTPVAFIGVDGLYPPVGQGLEYVDSYLQVKSNLDFLTHVNISGNLDVSQTSKLNDVIMSGNLTIDNDLKVDGNTYLNSIDVSGNLKVDGNTYLNSLDVSGNITINNDLKVDGNTYLNSIDVSCNLTVNGNTYLNSLDVSSNITINNDLTVNGNTYLNSIDVSGNLKVDGNTYLNSLDISGNITINNDLTVDGNTYLNSIDVSSNITINNDLTVNGNTYLNSIDVSGNLKVDGNTYLNSLDVSGNITINNDLTVNGNTYLNYLDVSGNLTVDGNTYLNSLDVSGNITINNDLTVDGNTYLNYLNISGNLNMNSNDINNVDILYTSNLSVSNFANITNTTITGMATITNANITGMATITNANIYTSTINDLTVNGNTKFNSFPTYEGTGIANISNQFITLQTYESTQFVNFQYPVATASQVNVDYDDDIVGGYTLQDGDLVLLAGQGNVVLSSENGIYIYNSLGSQKLTQYSDTSGVNLYRNGYIVDNSGSDYYGSIFIEYINPGITRSVDSSGVAFIRFNLTYPRFGSGLIVNPGGEVQVNPTLNFLEQVDVSEQIQITGTMPSTTIDTGSLVVSGGVGIAGNINVGGITNITNGTNSISTSTGALIVSGGVGISGNTLIGGNANVSGLSNLNNVIINSSTQSSNITTGALIVSGGIGVSKNVNIGDSLIVNGNTTLGNVNTDLITFNGKANSDLNMNSYNIMNANLITSTTINANSLSILNSIDVSGNLTIYKDLTVNGNTTLGNANTDLITFNGKANSNLDMNNNILLNVSSANISTLTNPITIVSNNLTVNGNTTTVSGNLEINSSTQSTTYGNGALVVLGGVGIAKDVNINGNLNVNETVTSTFVGNLTGTSTNATNATNTNITISNTNASYYPSFVSGTSGNLPQLVNSGLTYNPSTNTLTTGNLRVNGNTTLGDTNTDLIFFNGKANTDLNMNNKNINQAGTLSLYGNQSTSGGQLQVNGFGSYGGYIDLTTGGTNSNIDYDVRMVCSDGNANLVGQGTLNIYGNVVANNNLIVSGDTTLGNSGNNLINFNGKAGSNLDLNTNNLLNVNTANIEILTNATTNTYGNLKINSTIASTSSTTGALVVSGGVGIGSNVNIGGNLVVSGITTSTFFGNLTGTATNATYTNIATSSANASYYPSFVSGTSGNLGQLVNTGLTYIPLTNTLTTGNLTVNGNTILGVSTSDLIIFNGKASSNLDLNNKNLLNVMTANIVTLTNATTNISGITNITNTTQSTSTGSGALVVSGGVGIGANTFIGGNLSVNGSLLGTGNVLSIASNNYLCVQSTSNLFIETKSLAGSYIGWNSNQDGGVSGRMDLICNRASTTGTNGGFNFFIQDSSGSGNVSSPIAYIDGNGLLSIPSITVSGTTTSTYFTTSDYRIKSNIEPLDNTYITDNLNPVKYTNTQNSRTEIGFLAHELEQEYPYLVSGEKDGETLQSVNYIGLIGILVNEIKSLKTRVEILEKSQK